MFARILRLLIRPGRLAIMLLIGLTLAAGCMPEDSNAGDAKLDGGMLLWHAWPDNHTVVLNEAITRFEKANPDAWVKVRKFGSEEEMIDAFEVAAESGLGPDALITTSDHLLLLNKNNLVADISAKLSADDWNRYAPKTVEALRVGNRIYGIPESQNTMVLYYNLDLVDEPLATLDDLMLAAEQGDDVLINSDFIDAFWGIQAFGGALFDDHGRVILDRGGFINWLDWLVEARDLPGIILDEDRDALRARFIDGQAAYYVGDSDELGLITEKMGDFDVAVAPLPAGPVGPAGPFLSVNAFLVSAVAAESGQDLAVEFAKFATNAEQSAILMRELQHVPVNTQVRLNPRLDPVVGAIMQQTRNAVPMPAIGNMQTVIDQADDAYKRVLEGELNPVQAARTTTDAINRANGFEDEDETALSCDVGSVRLLNAWPQPYADALDQIVQEFRKECPTIIVVTTRMDQTDVRILPAEGAVSLARFDLIAGPQQLLADLAAQDKLQRIDAFVDPQTLQHYRPAALQAMRAGDALYGLPAYIVLDALYYNKTLVEATPALSVTALRTQAQNGAPVALEVGFVPGMWGVGSFGGDFWDERYDLMALEAGLAAWLGWLVDARDSTPLTLSSDRDALYADFLHGKTAYLVAEPARWFALKGELGDQLGLTTLPSGPGGAAEPLAGVSGFMLPATTGEENVNLALRLIAFATAGARAELTSGPATTLPATAILDDTDTEPLSVYIEQARTAALIPTAPVWPALVEIGDQAYAGVLNEGLDPAQAAREVISHTLDLFGQPTLLAEPTATAEK